MVTSVIDHARHTAYSDPGAHASLLADLPTDPAALSAVARNVVVHYRASGADLPEETAGDIDLRWMDRMLETDQQRHGTGLAEPREITRRLQGCCRDHTLLCVATLRSHGVPARSRVGFAGYFVDGWHHDHVIVEAWLEGRWRRFDPEVAEPTPALATPMDIPHATAASRGFVTAAQAWSAHRRGVLDARSHGVDAGMPELSGERFVFDEVIIEVAHRFGDELLLWDGWGRMAPPGTPVSSDDARWLDEVAALLLEADDGDLDAEQRLLERYRSDAGLHPGDAVAHSSPRGDETVVVALR